MHIIMIVHFLPKNRNFIQPSLKPILLSNKCIIIYMYIYTSLYVILEHTSKHAFNTSSWAGNKVCLQKYNRYLWMALMRTFFNGNNNNNNTQLNFSIWVRDEGYKVNASNQFSVTGNDGWISLRLLEGQHFLYGFQLSHFAYEYIPPRKLSQYLFQFQVGTYKNEA